MNDPFISPFRAARICTGFGEKGTFTRKKKTVMLSDFMRLHTEKGGIAKQGLGSRDQGIGNRKAGARDWGPGAGAGWELRVSDFGKSTDPVWPEGVGELAGWVRRVMFFFSPRPRLLWGPKNSCSRQ
jgi:hypothetical protein